MKKVFSETFPSGSVQGKVISITLVNNTLKTQDTTVPTDVEWVLEAVRAHNADNVDRVITINLYKESAKTNLLAVLSTKTVAAGSLLQIPNSTVAFNCMHILPNPFVLGAGWTISVTWNAGGASAGATDADGLTIIYRELSLA